VGRGHTRTVVVDDDNNDYYNDDNYDNYDTD
jgi:hypothetical protein